MRCAVNDIGRIDGLSNFGIARGRATWYGGAPVGSTDSQVGQVIVVMLEERGRCGHSRRKKSSLPSRKKVMGRRCRCRGYGMVVVERETVMLEEEWGRCPDWGYDGTFLKDDY